MLERTAGCLESGSLRRLLPRSEFKSRRMLHSAFWSHSATELDLSSLWTELVNKQGSEESDEAQPRREIGSSSGPVLEFLYPASTLAFLGQYSTSWILDRQDSRRQRSGLARLGQRLYSSAATSAQAIAGNGLANNIQEDPPKGDSLPDLEDLHAISALRKLIESGSDKDYEEAWRLYDLLSTTQRQPFGKDLISYLSNSQRQIDAERLVSLFGRLSTSEKDERRYSAVIRAYTVLDNRSAAIEMHKEALAAPHIVADHPTGSDYLISYFLDVSSYNLAWETWQRAISSKKRGRFSLWHAIDNMTKLQDRALALASFNEDYKDRFTRATEVAEEKSFATFTAFILGRALVPKSGAMDFKKHKTLWRCLRDLDADSAALYENTINKLLNLDNTKSATQCYRQFRQRTTGKISRQVLHGMLRVFCKHHSILGMQQVLDDFFRFYDAPTALCYRLCLSEFAFQGDADTVNALFDQFRVRFFKEGRPRSVDDLTPLLQVHAKRGEIIEVLRIFEEIEAKYGLSPNLVCYNILLNAYGKVQDVDGAILTFDRILHSSSISPDQYAFGTMMSVCVARGDLDSAQDLYQLVESMKMPKSSVMIDNLVLGHIQDGRITEAEKICEDALRMDLKGSRTRMWNYLLTAYAMRADLLNTNRVLRRMQDADLKFDALTYSALMQGLAMAHQPDRAYIILKKVMPEAGIRATNFHYAVVMGGYLANGEVHKVFGVHNRMIERGLGPNTSTQVSTLKASAIQDQQEGIPEQSLQRADQYFQEAISTMDAQQITQTPRKGLGHQGLDIGLPTAYFEYLIFVYGQRGASNRVQELYDRYLAALPANRRGEPSTKILSALMKAKLREQNYAGVAECWNLIFTDTKKQFTTRNLFESDKLQQHKVPVSRQFELSVPLSTYISSLVEQNKIRELQNTIADVMAFGFKLDNKNWNHFIQSLTRKWQYKSAFELCETMLMDGWMGWARIRWKLPGRNRLSTEERALKRDPAYLRPNYHTMLYLGRAMLELRASSAEGRASRELMDQLETSCPRTLLAIRTMQRVDNDLEREILRG